MMEKAVSITAEQVVKLIGIVSLGCVTVISHGAVFLIGYRKGIHDGIPTEVKKENS